MDGFEDHTRLYLTCNAIAAAIALGLAWAIVRLIRGNT